MRFKRGIDRYQISFQSIDDLIQKNNFIRLIDLLCEEHCQSYETKKGELDTGRKAYHPADLLKVIVYGYFHGVSSSRKLERECRINLEVKWLTHDQSPDHKTLSDFRKDNPRLIETLFKALISKFQKDIGAVGKKISIDGTKIKAYAKQEISIQEVKEKLEDLETQSKSYLERMHEIDLLEDDVEQLRETREQIQDELVKLEDKKKDLEHYNQQLQEANQEKMCVTDPDTKRMKGRYGIYWGYNVQASVDNTHHLITSITVTNQQNDKGQLSPAVEASTQTTQELPTEILADGGYYKITELEELEQKDIACYVALNRTSSQIKDEERGVHFTYHPQSDQYICTENKPLIYKRKKQVAERNTKVYQGVSCHTCPIDRRCTSSEQRTVHRNPNQEWLDQYHEKMNSEHGKTKLKERKAVAEHPFGTMKYYMGQMPLLLRGKMKVQTEMFLYALGYNLKRYIKSISETTEKELVWTA
jgi:transposase